MAKGDKRHRRGAAEILVIEDDEMNAFLFRDLLRSAAYSVHAAADGNEALQLLEIFQPDLIVMDAVIPGPSGFDLLKRLKSDPERRRIPIVIVTSLAAPTYRQAAMDAGCDAYVAKPMSVTTFLNTIRHLLTNNRPGGKTSSRLARCLEPDPRPQDGGGGRNTDGRAQRTVVIPPAPQLAGVS